MKKSVPVQQDKVDRFLVCESRLLRGDSNCLNFDSKKISVVSKLLFRTQQRKNLTARRHESFH